MKKKIFVFQGFPFHYEMIGFILEFCHKYDTWNIHLCNPILSENDGASWIHLYRERFPFVFLHSLPTKEEMEKQYDVILLLTDDDYNFPNECIIPSKTFCIDHHYEIRRHEIPDENHILIGPLLNTDHREYALSIFEYVHLEEKKRFLQTTGKPILILLGRSNYDHLSSIHHIIMNSDDFEIHVIDRFLHPQQSVPNIFPHPGKKKRFLKNIVFRTSF